MTRIPDEQQLYAYTRSRRLRWWCDNMVCDVNKTEALSRYTIRLTLVFGISSIVRRFLISLSILICVIAWLPYLILYLPILFYHLHIAPYRQHHHTIPFPFPHSLSIFLLFFLFLRPIVHSFIILPMLYRLYIFSYNIVFQFSPQFIRGYAIVEGGLERKVHI